MPNQDKLRKVFQKVYFVFSRGHLGLRLKLVDKNCHIIVIPFIMISQYLHSMTRAYGEYFFT
jgi:hypothetical protein